MINGEYRTKIAFWKQISRYFEQEDYRDFWSRVMFFNLLPDCIGPPNARFNSATRDQNGRALDRFPRVIRGEHHPHKVLVFSVKGWAVLAPMLCWKELLEGSDKFSRGILKVDGNAVAVFGLRHPQGASGELMRRAVQHILSLPLPPST